MLRSSPEVASRWLQVIASSGLLFSGLSSSSSRTDRSARPAPSQGFPKPRRSTLAGTAAGFYTLIQSLSVASRRSLFAQRGANQTSTFLCHKTS